MENDNSYDELKRDAKMCLSLMSQGLLYPQQVPLVLQVLKQVSDQNSSKLCVIWCIFVVLLVYYYKLFKQLCVLGSKCGKKDYLEKKSYFICNFPTRFLIFLSFYMLFTFLHVFVL